MVSAAHVSASTNWKLSDRRRAVCAIDGRTGYAVEIPSGTEIVEATEVAPDTVVGHMMLGQIVSVTSRDLGHHVGT